MQSFDVFFDFCLNKRLSKSHEAGDLRRHHAHYDAILMYAYHNTTCIPYLTTLQKLHVQMYSIARRKFKENEGSRAARLVLLR